jgi:hypothetical protein
VAGVTESSHAQDSSNQQPSMGFPKGSMAPAATHVPVVLY